MQRSILMAACLSALLPAFCAAATPAGQPAGASAATQQTGAPAPAAAPILLKQIIVTAELRKQPLQYVPMSIQALSGTQLRAAGVHSIDDLARLTPGVNFQRTGGLLNGEDSEIAIRGIQSSAGAQTTGIYLDDIPIQGPHLQFGTLDAYPALFDPARVEVLRGPQGTLFGASSEGGAIRYITVQPSLRHFSAYSLADGAYTDGGGPSYELGAAAGGPIIKGKLGYRVSASYRRAGGWVNRVNFRTGSPIERNSNWQDVYVLQGALTYAPTDNLKITPSIYFQDLYLHDTPESWSTLSNISAGVFRNGNLINNSSRDPWFLPSLRIEWDNLLGGRAKLISDTAYFQRNQSARVDYTEFNRIIYTGYPYAPPGHVAIGYFSDTQNNIYQELRLQSTAAKSKLHWLVGFWYEHQRENTTQFNYDPTLPQDVLALAGYSTGPLVDGVYSYLQSPFLAIDTQYALFGQASYRILKGLTLTAGVRVEADTFRGQAYYAYPVDILGPPVTSNASSSEHPTTPKFSLSYRPNRNVMLYASVAKGFRIGGINAPLPNVCDAELAALGHTHGVPTQYGADSLWSYELGAKTLLWRNRLSVDTSVYRINWSGIQQNIYLPLCGFQYTANLGWAESRGGDIDIRAQATRSLSLEVTAGYTDALYRKTIAGSSANVITSGDHLPANPWLIAASAKYDFPALGRYRPYLLLGWQMSTAQRSRTDVQNPADISYDPNIPLQPATRWLWARAGAYFDGFDVSVYGQNLTNTHPLLYVTQDIATVPFYYDYTWRPRTIGITVTYAYH